ncbi:Uncharacterised protein [Mycobacteroides abscessus subsp. abscessus]|nr:Uncharacterised protein [Mycobacteroides abscessus subsp. abscessus]
MIHTGSPKVRMTGSANSSPRFSALVYTIGASTGSPRCLPRSRSTFNPGYAECAPLSYMVRCNARARSATDMSSVRSTSSMIEEVKSPITRSMSGCTGSR